MTRLPTRILPLVLAVSVALPLAAAAQQGLPAGPKVTLTAVTQPAPTIPQFSRVEVPILRNEVPKATNGRIEVNLFAWPERNVNGPEVIRLVRSGQVEVGAAPLTTVSGDVPLLDGFDLAGMNPTIKQARQLAEAMTPHANTQLERLGVRLVATFPYPAQVFFCRKPVAGLADLKGLRVRTNGPSAADLLSALGAQPATIVFGEVYTALERGTVDCAITGTGSGNGTKWFEVSSTLYTLPVSWSTSGYFVNLSWWNKLDPQVRAYLERTFARIQDEQWKLGDAASQDGIDCNVGNAAGCKIGTVVTKNPMKETKAAPADIKAVKDAFASAVLPKWLQRCGRTCEYMYDRFAEPVVGVARPGK